MRIPRPAWAARAVPRPEGLPKELGGERVLAFARTDGGWVAGTALAWHDHAGLTVPWEQVQSADWDADEETLKVTEIGRFGEERPEHVYGLSSPDRLLMLVRERVTRTVVLQRWVGVARPRRGFHVIARKGPREDALTWYFEYAAGTDPNDPDIREAAAAALTAARAELEVG